MEIIQNTPENYKRQILKALQTRNSFLLKAVKAAKYSKRIVCLNTVVGLNSYHPRNDDYLIFSTAVSDKLDDDWIGSVLNGNPIKLPFGFKPLMDESEIREIYARILKRIT